MDTSTLLRKLEALAGNLWGVHIERDIDGEWSVALVFEGTSAGVAARDREIYVSADSFDDAVSAAVDKLPTIVVTPWDEALADRIVNGEYGWPRSSVEWYRRVHGEDALRALDSAEARRLYREESIRMARQSPVHGRV